MGMVQNQRDGGERGMGLYPFNLAGFRFQIAGSGHKDEIQKEFGGAAVKLFVRVEEVQPLRADGKRFAEFGLHFDARFVEGGVEVFSGLHAGGIAGKPSSNAPAGYGCSARWWKRRN